MPDLAFLSLFDDKGAHVGDFKAFMTAPAQWTRREWTHLGGLLAATRVAYEYDYDVREHFVPEPRPRDYHDVEDFVPVGLMIGATWLSARRTGDFDRFGEAKAMVRAGVLSSVSTLVFKLGLGRERPDEGVDRNDWWSGGRSMPSGHTAFAFSVGTVFAESGTPKRRWVRRTLGYGLGVGMMYLRVDHDSHWFSDTIPGAALGIAAGRFVLNRSGLSDGRAAMFASPLDDGAMLTFSFALD
ncbi:MAG TPA: phosphatase PAP2 family protein [Gammaproteobacteria bacterium]|nr:phosphatase PAP2 family protein [Gammaproteobacteria bacterium]